MPLEILSLKQMLNFGRSARTDPAKVLKSARFVQRELPKRLARRLLDLQLLPYIVVANPHIRKVYNAYLSAFGLLRGLPQISTMEENTEFALLLRRLVDEHAPMLDALATGLRECKGKQLVGPQLQLDAFLDNMLRSRISRRVIAEQHLHIDSVRPGYIGIICTDLDLHDAVEFAAQRTEQVCNETYGIAPEVKVSGDLTAKIPYIPTHLDYMLYELLKNSMRAVVEKHTGRNKRYTARLPPVQVRICGGEGNVTLRISDQGGGISAEELNKVWSYGYTSVRQGSELSLDSDQGEGGFGGGQGSVASGGEGLGSAQGADEAFGRVLATATEARTQRFRMAGLGFGLPLSRLYARYFGGDLQLYPIPGYGSDAHLRVPHLEDRDWSEQLEHNHH